MSRDVGFSLAAIAASLAWSAAAPGVSLRAGLELAMDAAGGQVAAGLDAVGTQVVGAEDGFPWALGTSLTVSAHLDYRL